MTLGFGIGPGLLLVLSEGKIFINHFAKSVLGFDFRLNFLRPWVLSVCNLAQALLRFPSGSVRGKRTMFAQGQVLLASIDTILKDVATAFGLSANTKPNDLVIPNCLSCL